MIFPICKKEILVFNYSNFSNQIIKQENYIKTIYQLPVYK